MSPAEGGAVSASVRESSIPSDRSLVLSYVRSGCARSSISHRSETDRIGILSYVVVVLATLGGSTAGSSEIAEITGERRAADATFGEQLKQLANRCRQVELEEQAEVTAGWQVSRDPRRQYLFLPRASDTSRLPPTAPLVVRQWHAKWLAHRRQQAAALYDCARRAAAAGEATLAYQWLCEVLREDPDHAEAQRVLGSNGGVGKAKRVVTSPQVDHPKLGWRRGQYWRIETPHFQISTNHGAAVAQDAAQRLEELHDVWRQLFLPFWSTPEALAARFTGLDDPLGPKRQHQVVIFRARDEYVAKLKPSQPQIELTSGYYLDEQKTVFLYVADEATRPTWYHEVTHQLLQETLDVPAGIGERGNMWIVEGIATYLESLRRYDGYVTVGGPDAQRLQFARYSGLRGAFRLPLSELVPLTRNQLQTHADIRSIYTQSSGLTHFLMDGDGGRWRGPAIRYLSAIYARRDTPESLVQFVGEPLVQLDRKYLEFLNVSDDDLGRFPATPPLRQLSLGRTAVTDRGLATLAEQSRLEWLDLSFTAATDAGLTAFRSARPLRQLFLEDTSVGDQSLTWIGELRDLEELDLTGTAVTDAGLAHVAQLNKLRELYLVRCQITDDGLTHLQSLKQLETLDLSETGVTASGIERLRRALPKWKP